MIILNLIVVYTKEDSITEVVFLPNSVFRPFRNLIFLFIYFIFLLFFFLGTLFLRKLYLKKKKTDLFQISIIRMMVPSRSNGTFLQR